MFNTHRPNLDELPSSKQLIRSTKIAISVALVILFTVVMPAEYAVDITGVGKMLGLTEMGEIKQSLAKEAEKQEEKLTSESNNTVLPEQISEQIPKETKNDTLSVVIAPNESAEVKVKMSKDSKIEYSWNTQGGALNYDVHGEPSGFGSAFEYGKGLNETEKRGEIKAKFDGTHG